MEVTCPSCQKKEKWEDNPYRPFCCKRCKLVDLGHWASESYRVPMEQADSDSEPDERE